MFNLPKAYDSRGSNMGRRNTNPANPNSKLYLKKLPLRDGYDSGGAYWGLPNNLYVAYDADETQIYLRASSRDEAKQKLNKDYPSLKFYR